jgi:aminopeptidase N
VTDSSVASTSNTVDPYLPGSGDSGYSVESYQLELDYRITTNRLSGTATITAVASEPLTRIVFDFIGLSATNVLVDRSRATRYTQSSGKLAITAPHPIAAGTTFTVVVRYGGSPAPRRSTWGQVGWEELTDGVLVASQPNGAPTWFPCNDRPGDKASYRIAVTLASSYRAIANGRLVSSTVKSSRTRWEYESVEPMASYLATLQIGAYQLRVLETEPVRQLAYIPEDLESDFARDFTTQSAMLSTFVRLFGPYPFEQYSVIITDDELEIPLEAQGLSIFGRNHVDGVGGSTRLIAHELAHSWFGNSLTAVEWKHIWLHEGFACYAEWIWSENSRGPSAQKLAEQQWSRLSRLAQDFAIGDPGPDLMFDDRLYKRGALTLHALRITMGDEAFFEMLRAWTDAHRYGSVTTDLFVDHAQGFTRKPVEALLRRWLFDEALPPLPKP